MKIFNIRYVYSENNKNIIITMDFQMPILNLYKLIDTVYSNSIYFLCLRYDFRFLVLTVYFFRFKIKYYHIIHNFYQVTVRIKYFVVLIEEFICLVISFFISI
jgi:hypothetical protein